MSSSTRRIIRFLMVSLLISAAWLVSCAPPPPPSLSSVVLAKGVKEANNEYEAVDPTSSFDAGTKEVHAVIKVANPVKGTLLRSVWSSLNGAGKAEVVSDKDYTFEDAYGLFSQDNYIQAETPLVGKYKLEVYLDGKVAQTVEFMVARPPASFLDAVTAAKVIDGGDGSVQAVDPTTSFPAGTAEIHTVVRINYPTDAASAQIIWSALDAQGQKTQVAEQTFTPSQPDLGIWTLDYTLTSDGGFAAGKYQIDIHLDGNLIHTFEITVN
jgi:hypothetical protein